MPRLIQISLDPEQLGPWTAAIRDAVRGMDVEIAPAGTPPERIDYLVYNIDSGLTDFTPFTGLRAILNSWAGVEAIVGRIRMAGCTCRSAGWSRTG